MYRQRVPNRGERDRNRAKRSGRAARERIRLKQLLVCLTLFLTLFMGKGIFPRQVQEMSGVLLAYLEQNTDFRGALIRLGTSMAEETSVLGELGAFCIAVFGGEEQAVQVSLPVSLEELSEEERRFLNSDPDKVSAAAHYLRLEQVPEAWVTDTQEGIFGEEPMLQPEEKQETEVVQDTPAVGVVMLEAGPQEKEPPEGHTMDQLSLGGLETCTPVMGTLWSDYGYRDHPMDGAYKFHSGVDLGADTGTAIGAFADGTVEYIGNSEIYGNYLQIDHGQGIKSFYAHCHTLHVTQGQQVRMGEEIAQVGSTGSATGPHLHLELKCGGMRIDPAYYIQYRTP